MKLASPHRPAFEGTVLRSGGQAGSALGAAGAEDTSAVAGSHSLAEAVLLGSMTLFGLIGSLHCACTSFFKFISRRAGRRFSGAVRLADVPPAKTSRKKAVKIGKIHYIKLFGGLSTKYLAKPAAFVSFLFEKSRAEALGPPKASARQGPPPAPAVCRRRGRALVPRRLQRDESPFANAGG